MKQLRIGMLLIMLFGMMASAALPPLYAVTAVDCCCSAGETDTQGSCPCQSKENCCSQCVLIAHAPYVCERHEPLISPALPPRSAPLGELRTAEDHNEAPPSPPPKCGLSLRVGSE